MTQAAIRGFPHVVDCTTTDLHAFEAGFWDALDEKGAILFRGSGLDAQGFHDFASRYSRGFLTSPFSDRRDVAPGSALQTVTLGTAGLGMHFEFGNSPLRPDQLWLYCVNPPAEGTGGETLLCDGAVICERLDPAVRGMLLRRPVRFVNYLPADGYRAIFTEHPAMRAVAGQDVNAALARRSDVRFHPPSADGRIVFDLTVPAIRDSGDGRPYLAQNLVSNAYQRPDARDAADSFSMEVLWDDGSQIEPEVLDAVRAGMAGTVVGVRWRAGDVLVVDNNRVMHGRRATTDARRELLLLSSFSTRFHAREAVPAAGDRGA